MTTKTVDMSERAFQTSVLDLAQRLGWKTAHFHDSRREVTRPSGKRLVIGDKAAAGFPDLVMIRDRRMIFAELKTETGKLSAAQAEWEQALDFFADMTDGVEYFVWRPAHWSLIERVLR